MGQTLTLYRLQQIDSQVDRIQARLQAIRQILEDDESLRQVKEEAQASGINQENAKQALHQAEIATQDQHIKIEQTEANLYSGKVHDPKELQDLQNDVLSLKRHLITLEDRLLDAMLAMEEADKRNQKAQSALDAAQVKWTEQNFTLQQEQSDLQRELQKLATERAAMTGTISEENVHLYDQLRQQRRGVAVSSISDNTCSACGSTLTPAQAQAVRSASQIARCPSCGRIIYGS